MSFILIKKWENHRPEIDPATKSGYQVEYRGAKAMNKMRREEKQEERLENQVQVRRDTKHNFSILRTKKPESSKQKQHSNTKIFLTL